MNRADKAHLLGAFFTSMGAAGIGLNGEEWLGLAVLGLLLVNLANSILVKRSE